MLNQAAKNEIGIKYAVINDSCNYGLFIIVTADSHVDKSYICGDNPAYPNVNIISLHDTWEEAEIAAYNKTVLPGGIYNNAWPHDFGGLYK